MQVGVALCRVRGHARLVVSLTRPSHSQKRVWYVTVQLIVLADSGCRVYTRSYSTQTANHIYIRLGGSTPRKWNKLLHCKVPDTFLRKGVAHETKGGGGGGGGGGGHSHRPCTSTRDWGSGGFRGSEPPSALVFKKNINELLQIGSYNIIFFLQYAHARKLTPPPPPPPSQKV